jgi:putative phage-type endonuclease
MENDRNEWLAWRHLGLGSSDASAVHGVSPWMTRYDLYEVKIQPEYVERETSFVQRVGNEMEIIARVKLAAMYNMEHGTDETFAPRRVQMKDLPFMKASLDGSTHDGSVIAEFKYQSKPAAPGTAYEDMTPGQQAHQNVLNDKLPVTSSNSEIACRVPYYYWVQIIHQLTVSSAKYCIFASFDGSTLNECIVEPDLKFMEYHIEKCVDFWKMVLDKTPPELTADDYKELRVKGAKGKIQKWKQLNALLKDTTSQIEELRAEIIAMVDHPRMMCDGVRIVHMPGNQGAIDYPRILGIPEVMRAMTAVGVEVDKVRKPNGKPYYKMELVKK